MPVQSSRPRRRRARESRLPRCDAAGDVFLRFALGGLSTTGRVGDSFAVGALVRSGGCAEGSLRALMLKNGEASPMVVALPGALVFPARALAKTALWRERSRLQPRPRACRCRFPSVQFIWGSRRGHARRMLKSILGLLLLLPLTPVCSIRLAALPRISVAPSCVEHTS